MKSANDHLCDVFNAFLSAISNLLREHGISAVVGSVEVDADQVRYEVRLDTSKKTRAFKKLKPEIAGLLNVIESKMEIVSEKDNIWNICTPPVSIVDRQSQSMYIIQNQDISGPFYTPADDFILHALIEDMLSCFYLEVLEVEDMKEMKLMSESFCLTDDEVGQIEKRLICQDESFLIFIINDRLADEQFLEVIKNWELNSPYEYCVVFKLQ